MSDNFYLNLHYSLFRTERDPATERRIAATLADPRTKHLRPPWRLAGLYSLLSRDLRDALVQEKYLATTPCSLKDYLKARARTDRMLKKEHKYAQDCMEGKLPQQLRKLNLL
jgi:hypothetical protein